ncbi:unnamed protein product, partial [Oppiella nova]
MSVCLCMSGAVDERMAELYVRQEITDLRLVCSDGSVMAHTVVMASMSEPLLSYLKTTVSSPAIRDIVSLDTSVADVKSVVDIVYFGRQSVDAKRVQHLTRVAKRLGLHLQTAVSAVLETTTAPHKHCLLTGHETPDPLPDQQMTRETEELAIDLSITSRPDHHMEDNVMKTIESIVANGPQKTPRRRKQSDPKPVIVHKSGKYDTNEELIEPMDASNGTVEACDQQLTNGSPLEPLKHHLSEEFMVEAMPLTVPVPTAGHPMDTIGSIADGLAIHTIHSLCGDLLASVKPKIRISGKSLGKSVE